MRTNYGSKYLSNFWKIYYFIVCIKDKYKFEKVMAEESNTYSPLRVETVIFGKSTGEVFGLIQSYVARMTDFCLTNELLVTSNRGRIG